MNKRKYIIILAMFTLLLVIIWMVRRWRQRKSSKQASQQIKQLVAEVNENIVEDKANAIKSEIARQISQRLKNTIHEDYSITVDEVNEVSYPKAIVQITKGDKTVKAVVENHQISLSGEKLDIETEQNKSINITTTWNEFSQKLFSLFESIK